MKSYHILPIYLGPMTLIHGRPAHIDKYGRFVYFAGDRYYLEVSAR